MDIWVLGGGLVRGLAHVGAIDELSKAWGAPDLLVCTSIGGVIGGAYAGGRSIVDMYRRGLDVRRRDVFRVSKRAMLPGALKQPSILRGDVYLNFLMDLLPVHEWSSLIVPMEVGTVNLTKGRHEWLGADGPLELLDAVYASSALPMYFPPLVDDSGTYVDGGLETVLGVRRALELKPTRLAVVDVSSRRSNKPTWEDPGGLLGAHEGALNYVRRRYCESTESLREAAEAAVPTVAWIRPDFGDATGIDFERIPEHMLAGADAATRALGLDPWSA